MQEGAVLEQRAAGAPTRQDSDALLSLPSDHYSRYALTHSIVTALRERLGGGSLRILDVGGHSSPLAHFLPDDRITLLDVEPEGSLTSVPLVCEAYVRGSGANLPFLDATFDIVTAHDTLEHVPPSLRTPFIDEMLRAASRLAILSGPVWREEVVAAERRIDQFVRDVMGWQQPFLGEHIELGLPDPAAIEALLAERKVSFTTIESADLRGWVIALAVRHYLAALPESEQLREAIDSSYNSLVTPGEPVREASYRISYVMAKERRLAEALTGLGDEVGSRPAPASDPLVALESLLSALRNHADSVRSELKRLHEAVFAAEKKSYELQGTHDELAKSLGDLALELSELKELIATRDEELRVTRARLLYIERSIPGRIAASRPYRWMQDSAKGILGRGRAK